MKLFKIKIQNNGGLHARPASQLVSLCHRFVSNIMLAAGNIKANGKNITEVLSLGAEKGDELIIKVTGKDELEAKMALKKLFIANIPGMEKIQEYEDH